MERAEKPQAIQAIKDSIVFGKISGILRYGLPAQEKMAAFSEKALKIVYNSKVGMAEETLSALLAEIRNFDTEEKKGLFGKTKRTSLSAREMQEKYMKTGQMLDQVKEDLTGQRIQLLQDIHMLEDLSELNHKQIEELELYIEAGKEKLEEERQAGTPQEICDEFERKLQDLMLTKAAALQLEPQIMLLQKSQASMASRIQSAINNMIPMWKSRMVVLLGLENLNRSLNSQAAFDAYTGQMLQETARQVKESAKTAAERSAQTTLDITSIQQTNSELLRAFDDVCEIQKEGLQKRREVEKDLEIIKGSVEQHIKERFGMEG